MTNRGTLPMLHRGDQLRADHYGVVTDFVNNPSMPISFGRNAGIYDASGGAFTPTKRPRHKVRVYSPAYDYPRHSALLLGGDANSSHVTAWDDGSDPYWGALRQDAPPGPYHDIYSTTTMHRIFVTNEDAEIYNEMSGWATIIGDAPIAVLADPYYPPVPFMPCGPEHGKTTVSCRSAGLIALTNVNDYGLVWVRQHTPRFFLAKTSSLLSPPDDIAIPNFCNANVYFPKPATETANWPDEIEISQDVAFLGLEVYTHDTTLEVPNDTFIHITFEWGRWYITWVAC